MDPQVPIPVEHIEHKIYRIRGQKIMLDSDLAQLYGIKTFRFNEAVKRNPDRFPADFMFQLTEDETVFLRCQSGTSKIERGGRRYLPYVFTEQGVAMLSNVLNQRLLTIVALDRRRKIPLDIRTDYGTVDTV